MELSNVLNRISRSNALRWVSVVVIVLSALALVRQLPMQEAVSQVEGMLQKLGPWAPIGLGVAYVLATVLLAPASVLTLAAGALFGLGTGFVTVSLASTTGATLAFLIARYLARARVERLIAGRPALKAIDRAIEEGGWRIVALLRLSPAVPFNVQNYFYGLTSIPLRSYILASWIAMMPGTFMYVYLGHITGSAVGGRSGRSPMEWALLLAGLVATVVVTVYITRLARRQLKNYAPSVDESESSQTDTTATPDDRRARPLLPVLAAISAAIAIAATLNSDRIAAAVKSSSGPPVAESKKAYAENANDLPFRDSAFDFLYRSEDTRTPDEKKQESR